jgi:hypothetical protein
LGAKHPDTVRAAEVLREWTSGLNPPDPGRPVAIDLRLDDV